MNVFYNTIVLVKDIEKSKKFYTEVLGLKIVEDYGTITSFENHFTIHNSRALLKTIFKKKPLFNLLRGKRNIDIYFETDNIEEQYNIVLKSGANIIHDIQEQAWGQRVFRFFDPDKHIVEIGEPLHLEYLKRNI